jgi:hypothetical protein
MNRAVHGLLMVQAGQIQALKVANDSLRMTLMHSLPPLIHALQSNLDVSAEHGATELDEAAEDSYLAAIDAQRENLAILARQNA